MTISVNIHEAKAQLSHLLALARQGEEVVICTRNVPEARLVPVVEKPRKKRIFGQYKGKIEMLPGFDDPMNEEELALWHDAPLVSDPTPVSLPKKLPE
jgi:prevent-host-death family protein